MTYKIGVFSMALLLLAPFYSYAQVIDVNLTAASSTNQTAWDFIHDYIKEDSIVCLGEENHWIEKQERN